ncbi:NAD-dependent dehydratase [Staphylococcus warneri]|uniref:NAD-dependent epimerase/dehydratase family protein n=1 Tax=Staphylococcus warneri TaxID=1292 RepID=UPI00095239A3|nr:NAD-dependent epimerase/dehydratase family protein [Staphylococcus warneri]MBE9430260.1 NAD-dependent epimerase/dehydratase family protein [Staphylococcus epidermidis]OLS04439.1 NAD-dependent dehydratase [Staphylococcus epidermidis]PTI61371.1 NAD-dependent dehydratase [Staphylococcus warneri]
MKALITGGAGFIGSHIAHKCIQNNIEVHVIDNLSTGRIENIPYVKKEYFYQEDINNLKFVSDLIKKEQFDYVIHLAAMVSVVETVQQPGRSNQVNIDATLNILETLRLQHSNVKRFLFASSAAVYGQLEGLPKAIHSRIDPRSPYAVQKYAGESYAKIYHQLYQLPTVSLRFFNVYGPKQNPYSDYSGVISILNHKFNHKETFTFYGDGLQTRDFIYIDDLVEACWLVLHNDNVNGNVYNLGTGKQTTLKQMVNIFEQHFNYSIPYVYDEERVGDIKHSYADISPIQSLGFNPQYSVEKGIQSYLEYQS